MADIYSRMNRIMDSMLTVYNHLKKNAFAAVNDIEFEISFRRVREFFNLGPNEAALFTYIFVNYFDFSERPVCMAMLSQDAGANPLRLLEFKEEFISLEEKGFIKADTVEDPVSQTKYYRVPEGVVTAIVKNDEHLLNLGLRAKDKNLTYPEDIPEKDLFYMDNIREEVKALGEYLEKDKLEAIQNRLSEKAMPKGVCIMLYGESGTGKTETVFQLAKKTNRAIFHIDIGSVISQWHGGTERNLSVLFDKYARLCRQAKARGEEIPILLFNEADALFGKRVENPTHGAEIDENYIQSVLLDYLEKQNGIVIATTNLAGNFDDAFERRFLFKIKFEKPNLDIKKKIWKNKVNWLNKTSVEHLASSYALSGAEIDNVVRKATMNEVLTGKRSSVHDIESYCQKEKLEGNKSGRIGFAY